MGIWQIPVCPPSHRSPFDQNRVFDSSCWGRPKQGGKERRQLLQGGFLNCERRLGRGRRVEAMVATDMLVGQWRPFQGWL